MKKVGVPAAVCPPHDETTAPFGTERLVASKLTIGAAARATGTPAASKSGPNRTPRRAFLILVFGFILFIAMVFGAFAWLVV